MHCPYRRTLIGISFALLNVIRWERQLHRERQHRLLGNRRLDEDAPRQRKVFGFRTPLLHLLHNATTARLVPAGDDERDDADVIWSAQIKEVIDLMPLAIESMYLRLQRQGKIEPSETNPEVERMEATLRNFTQDELNGIDPDWQIFLLEGSDRGMGNWPYWHMQHKMAPLLGWNRLNYATRSTQSDRYMDLHVGKMKAAMDPSLPFGEHAGKPINFTAFSAVGGTTLLDKGIRSVQRLCMTVREDMVQAIDEYMKDHHRGAYDDAWDGSHGDVEEARLRLSDSMSRLPRRTDVRTFWNASVCNMACAFRNQVAETVATLPGRHATSNFTTNTDVVGFIHKKGRNNIHPDFIDGMMQTKVVVLAQRDRWEGHLRLYEVPLSGALVMSEPQVYWPHGTVDGESIVVYHSLADLEQKLLYFLDPANEEERMRIGRRGREVALTHHRSWQQAERIYLNDMEYRNEYGLANKPW